MNQSSFERVIQVLNEMQSIGIISTYAIGGGFATIYYTVPFTTEDIDIFVLVPSSRADSIDYLGDIYAYLKNKSYSEVGPYIKIEGELVQFLLAMDPPLFKEAVEEASDIIFGSTRTRIIAAEHLAAMMVNAGTLKHLSRVEMLLEQKVDLNKDKLNNILRRHELMDKWVRFERTRREQGS